MSIINSVSIRIYDTAADMRHSIMHDKCPQISVKALDVRNGTKLVGGLQERQPFSLWVRWEQKLKITNERRVQVARKECSHSVEKHT